MKYITNMIARALGLLISPSGVLELTKVAVTSVLALIFFLPSAIAAPIILQRSLHFCDVRSVNDAGLTEGKVLTFGVDFTPDGDLIVPLDGFADSDGVSPPSTAVASQPGVTPQNLAYFPLPESPNHFVRVIPFDCDNPTIPDLRGSWSLSISNGPDTCAGGGCTLNGNVVTNPVTPSVFGIQHLPFVASFSFEVADDPTTPLFKWTFLQAPPTTEYSFGFRTEKILSVGRAPELFTVRPLLLRKHVIRCRQEYFKETVISIQFPFSWTE